MNVMRLRPPKTAKETTTQMKTYTIDADNSITVFASEKEAATAGCTTLACFTSEQELGNLAATWPGDRLIEIWNSLPGVTRVKKLPTTNRP